MRSQEELRRQLGEQLPGALSIAAKAMNVTTAELEQMIQKGISAEEFLPKFSAELRRSVRDGGALAASLKTVTAAQERLSTQLQLGIRDFSDAGGKEGILSIFAGLSDLVKQLNPTFRKLGFIIKVLGNSLGFAFKIIGDIVEVFFTIVDVVGSLVVGILKIAGGLEDSSESSKKLNKNLKESESTSKSIGRAWDNIILSLKKAFGRIKLFISPLVDIFSEMSKFIDKLDFSGPIAFAKSWSEAASDMKKNFEEQDKVINKILKFRTAKNPLATIGTPEASEINRDKFSNLQNLFRARTAPINSGNTVQLTIQGVDTNNMEDIKKVVDDSFQRHLIFASPGIY